MDRYRVALTGQCGLFREAVAQILSQGKFTVVGQHETVSGVLRLVSSDEPPHVLIYSVPETAETEEWALDMRQARATFVGLRTVVLADVCNSELLSKAVEAEVDALLSKNISGEVLRCSLELVMLGQQLFPAPPSGAEVDGRAARLARARVPAANGPTQDVVPVGRSNSEMPALSQREDQILRFLASGTRNKLIAYDLGISEASVKFHIRALLRKLGAANRTQAAMWAMNRMAAPTLKSASIQPPQPDAALLVRRLRRQMQAPRRVPVRELDAGRVPRGEGAYRVLP